MKFKVERTSMWNGEKPCEEAYKGQIPYVQELCFKTFEEFKDKYKEDFLSRGTNHRIIKKGIARDMGYEDCWYVDINSLEELVALEKKYGNIIITRPYTDSKILELEIYDTYRE